MMTIKVEKLDPKHFGFKCVKCGNMIVLTDDKNLLIKPGHYSCERMLYKKESCDQEYIIPITIAEGAKVVVPELNY